MTGVLIVIPTLNEIAHIDSCLASALAQSAQNATNTEISAQADSSALSARNVSGKRLLDANGMTVGQIEGVAGDSAKVRTPDGQHIAVDMARLSHGNGPNTIIENSNSDADSLNHGEADKVQAESNRAPTTTETTTTIIQPLR